MPELLIVVARHQRRLFEYLKRELANDDALVILDRRHYERRARPASPPLERRREQSRRIIDITPELRSVGWAIIKSGTPDRKTPAR